MAGSYNSGKWFRVRNWKQFQHYTKRNPPWVKLHFALLTSEDWVTLDDASRVLAIACMLIASRNEGHVPDSPHFVQRVAYLKRPANFKPLIECGFLEKPLADNNVMQADASALQADARPETETETEKKRSSSSDDDGFSRWWDSYPRKVGKAAAAKAYAKAVKIVSPERLLAALEQQKPSWTDPKYIPHPTTWLNQGRWDDELALSKPAHLEGII